MSLGPPYGFSQTHYPLPIGEALQHKGLFKIPNVCRCGQPETILHVCFHSSFATDIWNLVHWSQSFDPSACLSFKMDPQSSHSMANLPLYSVTSKLFLWIYWFIWISRNKILFLNKTSIPAETILKALISLTEWELVQPNKATVMVMRPRPPPSQNLHSQTIFCNTDAAWHSEQHA